MTVRRKPGPVGPSVPATSRQQASAARVAYLGGELESGGGVELGLVLFGLAASGLVLPGGVVLSAGGVAVVPGAVDWSAGGGAVVVSAGGEPAEPAGEVDSCLEQAANSASEPTHNNRTLRFIRSPHYCNGTVTRGPSSVDPTPGGSRKSRSVTAALRRTQATPAPLRPRPGRSRAAPWYSWPFL